jgi:hypothetical protein
MVKETSSAISTLASHVLQMDPTTATSVSDTQFNQLLRSAKTLAGSALSQDETPGQEPETFLHRLKRERANLSGKLDALTLFLRTHVPSVSATQRHLLDSQHAAMTLYLKTLDLRLEDLALQPRPITDVQDRVASATMPELGEPKETGGHDEDRDGPVPFGG